MALTPGSRLGRYEVVGTVGSGGMGVVYKARDSRLDRTVALKLLPEPLAPTSEQRQQFEREARAISQLNHPHICTLYDFGSHDGIDFLVMEYLDGETLAERLQRGALAVPEALKCGIEICDALDAAHSLGITHRDVKPGNIMLTRTGVKLLDFGLAKTHVMSAASVGTTHSITALPHTRPGSIIGTFQYMAPEQLEGKEADARTDIFAFGAVLYEMLTGQRAFSGESQASLIAAILDTEPPLPQGQLGEVLKRCLAKSPTDRWQSIRDVSALLSWTGRADGPRSSASKRIWVASLASALALATVVGTAVWRLRPEPARAVVRLSVELPPETFLGGAVALERDVGGSRPSRTSVALSPNGRVLVFSAVGHDENAHLFRRRLGERDSTRIEGTQGAVGPAFSPDGAFVTFWSGGELKKVALEGGLPVSLCKAPLTFGTSWGPDGRIAFAGESGGLWQVKASGGEPEPLTTLATERGEQSHRLPHFLPNGRGLLFSVIKSGFSKDDEVVLQDLSTAERLVLARGGADGRYAASGHVLYARESVLMAMPFDLQRMRPTGAPTPVLSSVMEALNSTNDYIETRAAQLSLSNDGTLVYAEGGVHPSEERHLLWVDPAGRETPAQLEAAPWVRPRLSPDEALVALEGANSAVWIHDVLRGTTTRLTLEGEASHAQLSPDGRQVAFLWETGDAPPGIFVQAADGSGSPTRVSTGMHAPSSWSADGRVIAFVSDGDVWTLTLPELRVETVARTPFDEMYPTFSPDGKWLAYTSDESGRNEVFVTAFPTPGAKHKISTEGGHSPAWARTGKELFYLHSNPAAGRYVQDFMAVEVSSSPQFSASRPHKLFQRLASRTLPTRGYDVTADGRFLILTPYDPPLERVTRLQVVLNFFEELKRLAPPR